ncbi:lipopolysaccharide biosynthesis protein [Allonocardiopsis opalescens]|nr:lipopolysaccharide biosynthesis protein [Allonocardiopsis opalescens]
MGEPPDAASAAGPADTTLGDYAALLRRRWWIVAGGLAAGLAVAGTVFAVLPRAYTATSTVQVDAMATSTPATGPSAGRAGEVNLDTEAQLVTSAEVGERAIAALGGGVGYPELREGTAVTVPPNSTVLEISYTAPTPERARDGAQALAESYLEQRLDVGERQVRSRIRALENEITDRTDDLDAWSERAAEAAPGSADLLRAQTQLQVLGTDVAALRDQITPLATAELVPGRVITAARPPEAPSRPVPVLWLGGGLMTGLLAGLALAWWTDRRDRSVHRPQDVERRVGLPVLLDLPPGSVAATGPLSPHGRTGQGYHDLGLSVAATLGSGSHVVLVTGTGPGGAADAVALNLAAALARTGHDTLLVGADLTVPDDDGDRPGLAELLLAAAYPAEVERRPAQVPALRVIGPGRQRARAADLVQRGAMTRLIEKFRAGARYVVVRTAATTDRADATAMAAAADAAVLVVELGRTRHDTLTAAVAKLSRRGAAVLGAVTVPPASAAAPGPEISAPVPTEAVTESLPRVTDAVPADRDGSAPAPRAATGADADAAGQAAEPEAGAAALPRP